MKKLSDLYNRCAQVLSAFRSATRDFANAVYTHQPVKGLRAVYNNAAFKAARTYAWPFRLTKALLAQWRIIPVILAHQLIQTPTVMLFPTGEEYLKDKGVDSAIAHELSDRTIRVRERDFLGTLHSINDLPTVIGWAQGAEMLLEPVQAYAHPDLATRLLGQCPVTMPPKDMTARAALGVLGNLSAAETAQMENVPMTDEQARMAVAFHEFSHCSTVNTKVDEKAYKTQTEAILAVGNHAESDADARGFAAAAREFKNPEIPKAFMYARALNKNAEAHDTALYLDAILHGQKPPHEIDAMQATQDVFDQLDIYQRMHKTADAPIVISIPLDGLDGGDADLTDLSSLLAPKNAKIGEAIAMEHLVKEHPDMFNATSKRRAELFIEAVKYFWPTQYEAAHAKAPPSTHVFNMAPQTLQLTR